MNERLIHKNEKVYFITSLVISIITYLLLIASLIGIVYILIGLIITFFLHGIMVAHFRSNGIKEINYFSTYPQLYGYQSSGFEVTEVSA